jgi:hypothetical protein
MGHRGLAAFLSIISILALAPVTSAFRKARAHGDWDSTATFVFLVGTLSSLPTILSNLVTGRVERVDAFGTVQVGLATWARQLEQLTTFVLIAGAVAFVVHRCRSDRVRINGAACLAMVVWLVVSLSDGLNGHSMFAPRQWALFALLVAAMVSPPGRSALLGAAAVGLLLTLLGGLQCLVHSESVFRPCRVDKCGPLGTLYSGIFLNENQFGLPIAVSIPFVWIALRGPSRYMLSGYVAFISLITGSRSAGLTAGAAVVLLCALRPAIVDVASGEHPWEVVAHAGRSVLAILAVVTSAIGGFLIVYIRLNPNSLTQRPYFWGIARSDFKSSPIYGLGASAWERLYETSRIPVALRYSIHNEWLDLMHMGGMIALTLFVSILVGLFVRAGREQLVIVACLLVPGLVASSLERPWSFAATDWMTFSLLALTLLPARPRVARTLVEGAPHTTEYVTAF